MQAALAHECNHNVRFQLSNGTSRRQLADWVAVKDWQSLLVAEFHGGSHWALGYQPVQQLEEIKLIIFQLQPTGGGNGSLSLR